MSDRVLAATPGPLLQTLIAALPTWGRNTLRERLRAGCVLLNGVPVVRADQPVAAGDEIRIQPAGAGAHAAAAPPFPILHCDDDLCAIDKPSGLLSVASDDERQRTALALLRVWLGRTSRGDLWPAHRIDRETSGVLLFARTLAARDAVQAAWDDATKTYDAIVEGHPEPPEGVIEQPLREDRNLRVHVGAHPDARPARTRYRTLATGRLRSALEVAIDTGRKHQIRAHLAWLGCPVVGDDRYGTRDRRLFLHARELVLPHPRDGRRLVLHAPTPAAFAAALR